MPDALLKLLSDEKTAEDKIIDKYDNVRVVDSGEELPVYKINLPFLTPADKSTIEAVQRVATRVIDLRKEDLDSRKRKESIKEKVEELLAKSTTINAPKSKLKVYADIVSREIGGYGLLDYLLDDDQLEEVMVVPPKRDVYVFHRKHGMLLAGITLDNDEYVRNIIERIARDVGRRVDTSYPLLDSRLPSGDRVNATIKPASIDGPTLTIRKFREDPYTMVDMIKFGTLSEEIAAFLWTCVDGMSARPSNIIISGGTSSGKTTLLNCLAMFIRPTDRVVTIEDTAELKLPLKHWLRLETRPAGIEGTGELSMDILLKNALRMRPDRMIVGEVRHKEAATLFTAMNTGHQGSMGTIHANNSDETLIRLSNPPMSVPEQMSTALDLIVVENKINDRRKGMIRRITEISEVGGKRKPELNILYEWDGNKDRLEQIAQKFAVKKKIASFGGTTEDEFEKEVNIRAKLLKTSVEKGFNDIKRFSMLVHKYYSKADDGKA